MKHVALAALLLLVPLQAAALDTEELLGLVAMPLAVAAVSNATGVPAEDLSNLVASLNRADVSPTQVVQVVRYAPVALVVETEQPAFVEFVDTQVDQGVTGPQLVTVIDQRLRTYDVTPQFVTLTEPATTYVLSDRYLVTRQPIIGDTNDLLALIAMPLAVAAAAEVTGVPLSDLSRLVASLNQRDVPPVQFVEVVRTQVSSGVPGPQLVQVIDTRLRTFEPVVVAQPRTRVVERRDHPHGGPPGQIKKQIGVQTGAEVVHSASRQQPVRPVKVKERGNDRVRIAQPVVVDDPGKGKGPGKGQGNGGGQGQGQGNNKGQGKGKGKG